MSRSPGYGSPYPPIAYDDEDFCSGCPECEGPYAGFPIGGGGPIGGGFRGMGGYGEDPFAGGVGGVGGGCDEDFYGDYPWMRGGGRCEDWNDEDPFGSGFYGDYDEEPYEVGYDEEELYDSGEVYPRMRGSGFPGYDEEGGYGEFWPRGNFWGPVDGGSLAGWEGCVEEILEIGIGGDYDGEQNCHRWERFDEGYGDFWLRY